MKFNRNLINGLAFILVELLIFCVYQKNSIRCEPCLEGSPCPPCVSEVQVAAVWIGSILAVLFVLWQLLKWLSRRREN